MKDKHHHKIHFQHLHHSRVTLSRSLSFSYIIDNLVHITALPFTIRDRLLREERRNPADLINQITTSALFALRCAATPYAS